MYFILIAVLSILLGGLDTTWTTRSAVITTLVCLSRLELGSFLLYRVLKRGKDARFDSIRGNCLYFLGFWIWQILWVYVVMTSCIYINSASMLAKDTPIGLWDYLGWAVFVVGFVIQASSDLAKNAFRSDPANAKKVCKVGFWYYSRHPNFCGEVMMWWGVFLAGVPVFAESPAGFSTVASPLFTMLVLLLVSGIPQAEGQASKRWFDGGESQELFEAYFESTPPLWLFPPALYKPLPMCVKRVLCFELAMYKYDGDAYPSLGA